MPDTLAAGNGNETRKTKLEIRFTQKANEYRVSCLEFRVSASELLKDDDVTRGVVTTAGSLKSQGLAEGFLRFVVFVTVAFVELVGAFADHVRADRHAFAAMLAGPILGGGQ